jgi:hypothetical protein
MGKILTELKARFASFETIEGASLLAIGLGLFFGQALGLLPFITIGLIALGAYKVFIKR